MTSTSRRTPLVVHIMRRRVEMHRAWPVQPRGIVRRPRGSWSPPTDVYETASGGVVRCELAGMQPEDLEVIWSQGTLTIAGQRPEPQEGSPTACHQKEIATGQFRTEVDVPWPVDAENLSADYHDGYLTIDLPRSKPATVRQTGANVERPDA